MFSLILRILANIMYMKCVICELSFNKKDKGKHLLQKYHKTKLVKFINNFNKKISRCKNDVNDFNVISKDTKECLVWCNFCAADICYNSKFDHFQIMGFKFYCHLSGDQHINFVKNILKEIKILDNYMQYCVEPKFVKELESTIHTLNQKYKLSINIPSVSHVFNEMQSQFPLCKQTMHSNMPPFGPDIYHLTQQLPTSSQKWSKISLPTSNTYTDNDSKMEDIIKPYISKRSCR